MMQCSGRERRNVDLVQGEADGRDRVARESAGVRLTFRATVVAGAHSLKLRAPVTVRLP